MKMRLIVISKLLKSRIASMKPLGVVLWQGRSRLDRKPIVAIMTGLQRSKNPKTGNMLQVWILRQDIDPIQAIHTGADKSICGACPLRAREVGTLAKRDCYVRMTGPAGIYKAWKRGSYADAADVDLSSLLSGRRVRFGAYGDPAAVPVHVWARIARLCVSWTGYTHQSGHRNFDARILDYCMVSADRASQVADMPAGARSFRVLRPGDAMLPSEVYCPADAPKTKGRVTCSTCGLCRGSSPGGRNVAIAVHGAATGKQLILSIP